MTYTQAPKLTTEELDAYLSKATFARLCSLNPNGTIHAAPVSCKYENGRFLVATPDASRKARNLKRDPTVTLLFDTVGEKISDFKGAIIYGRADLKEATLSQFMFVGEVWIPADKLEAWSKGLMKLTKWSIITIEVEGTTSFDYAKDDEYDDALQG